MATRTDNGLIVDVRDRVAYATLDRPDRLNALSRGLQADLVDAFDDFSTDPAVWAVLLSASGDRAFSAGIDLKEMGAQDARGRGPVQPMAGARRNFFEVILECAKPTVAALFGFAMGGGCELALACDVRIAADDLRIGMPEAKRGMGANFGSQVLPRLIPTGIAYELLYTGEPIDADAARHWGLVNRVVPRARLADEAEAFVRAVVANAPLTTQRYKAMIGKGRELPLAAALRLDVGPNPYKSEDRKEGVAAFNEKRPPNWQAR
jgi:enoyl-CoA hydratase